MSRYICPLFSRFSAYVTHDADLFMNYHSGLPSACHQGGHSSLRNGYLPRSQARGRRWDHGPRAATILTGLIHQPDCVFSFLFSDFAIAGEREVLARPAPLPV